MAFFNARVSGSLAFGVTDAGQIEGLRLGTETVKRKWLDECEQAMVARAQQVLSHELDPALAVVDWDARPVVRHPKGSGFYVVVVRLTMSSHPPSTSFFIRHDDRDDWCWPLKVRTWGVGEGNRGERKKEMKKTPG